MIIDELKVLIDASTELDAYKFRLFRWYDDDQNTAGLTAVLRQVGGGPNDRFIGAPYFQLLLLGNNRSVRSINTSAQAIKAYLLDNFKTENIIDLTFPADVQGPFYIENDRVIFQLDINALESRGS